MTPNIVGHKAEKPNGLPPLLFVHGAFAGAWCWEEHFLPWFASKGFDAYALDLPGRRGQPDEEKLQTYSIGDYLDAVLEAIDAMPELPVLVGHSMGGFLAWQAAEVRDVAGLVLMAPVPPTGLAAPAMQLMMSNLSLFMDVARVHVGDLVDAASMHGAVFAKATPKAIVEKHMKRFQPESRLAVTGLYAGHVPNILAIWGTPMKIVGATEDQLIPTAHVHWAASMAGRSAHIYEGMGHGLMLEAGWETVASDIADWISDTCGD